MVLRQSFRVLLAACGFAVLAVGTLPTAHAQPPLILHESGFTQTGLGSGVGPKAAECSPGGIWGDYVYIGESNGDAIERIDFLDNMSVFATGSPEIDFPVGMEFGPGPASNFGDFLYVASYQSNRITRIDAGGTPVTWQAFSFPSDVRFDPTGAYGTDLFVIEYFGSISTIDVGGTITPFTAAVNSAYMRFGPGGAWGTGLYATSNSGGPGIGVVTIDIAGNATLFTGGLVTPEQFDWATGGAFGGDMFLNDFGDGKIYRVKPDGTKTIWAEMDPNERPAGMAFCNGCLYITSFGGGCWRVCESPVSVEESTWGAIKTTYRDGDSEQ